MVIIKYKLSICMYINQFFLLLLLLANNLYGYAMCKYMPISDFTWYPGNPEVALEQLQWMRESDDIGRFYEVDITYPSHLHKALNDIPFLPHASTPPGSIVRKLMATFLRKERYVVHYMNLKQAIANGVVVEKVITDYYYYYVHTKLFTFFVHFRRTEC